MNFSGRKFYSIIAIMLFAGVINAQEVQTTKTLLRSDVRISEMWVPEVKINSIQGNIGTLIGFYGGALVNRTFLIGISGGVNLSNPKVNYGYFGGIAQVIFHPDKMVHFSGQLLFAWGSTKDYEDPKEGLLDNFWNISGENFYLTEPGINAEVNLKENITLVVGVSYRFVFNLDSENPYVQYTHITNEEMQGLNFNIGIKFGKKTKPEKQDR